MGIDLTATMPWTLANILRTHAKGRGTRPIITYGERTIAFEEMHARQGHARRVH